MAEKEYIIPYSYDTRKRHYHKASKGKLEGDVSFNTWSNKVAKSHAKEGQPIVHIRIKRLKPIHSRIEDLEIVV